MVGELRERERERERERSEERDRYFVCGSQHISLLNEEMNILMAEG